MNRTDVPDPMARIRGDAKRIARHFGLPNQSIEPECVNVERRGGVRYSNGSIRTWLRHVSKGRPLECSSVVNPLWHGFAHLRCSLRNATQGF